MWPASEAWRAPVGDFPPPWASAWGDDRYGLWADLTVMGVTQRMRWIEPTGADGFYMGAIARERQDTEDPELLRWANKTECEPKLMVIDKGFWLADTPCTQAFWKVVMGRNPSYFKESAEAGRMPVEQVTWDDVGKFIKSVSATFAFAGNARLSLPTEVQWEYAARAGSRSAYWWGDIVDSAMANWNVEQGGTTPVGRYPANPWGLFDMHGNVWEWCVDLWLSQQESVESEAERDTDAWVVRGGSWINRPYRARSAYRHRKHRSNRARFVGFRILISYP